MQLQRRLAQSRHGSGRVYGLWLPHDRVGGDRLCRRICRVLR
jgi:hypothetical protein